MAQKESLDVTEQRQLFTGQPQYENFARMQMISPVSHMQPADTPFEFLEGTAMALPTSYEFEDNTLNLHQLLGATHTSVLHAISQHCT